MEEFNNQQEIVEKNDEEKKTYLGTASLVLGIIASFSSPIFIGIIPAIMSLTFGAVCLTKKPNATQKAFSIAGILLSILGLVLFILMIIALLRGSF